MFKAENFSDMISNVKLQEQRCVSCEKLLLIFGSHLEKLAEKNEVFIVKCKCLNQIISSHL